MALWEFLNNLGIAYRQLQLMQVDLSAKKWDSGTLTELVTRSESWLTPQAVEGYDREDFEFLGNDEQQQLHASVAAFVAACTEQKPTERRVEAALTALAQIIEIVPPDRFADSEALRAGKRIERWAKPALPAWISELKFQTGSDSSGEDSIWIRAIVDGDRMEDPGFVIESESARRILFSAAQRFAEKRWPYISFRSRVDETLYTSGLAQ